MSRLAAFAVRANSSRNEGAQNETLEYRPVESRPGSTLGYEKR
ncbi:hypothetical protein NJ7G_0469 [Natrinema sp. J7-2]|nr:hypothetical protein NJ7G_0469 [Natrinema sp. J7-2]